MKADSGPQKGLSQDRPEQDTDGALNAGNVSGSEPSTPVTPVDPDVEWLMREYGLTLEEAIRAEQMI